MDSEIAWKDTFLAIAGSPLGNRMELCQGYLFPVRRNNITIGQNPTISLADDVAVNTEGPWEPEVAGLVYVTAFALDHCESVPGIIESVIRSSGGCQPRPWRKSKYN